MHSNVELKTFYLFVMNFAEITKYLEHLIIAIEKQLYIRSYNKRLIQNNKTNAI